ncbi:MAG: hypothetical protein QM500_17030 [Methylococcales bacterium]
MIINNKPPSRTSGKFDTREELVEHFSYLINERKMSISSAARCCGISRSTGCHIKKNELGIKQT